MTIHFVHLSRNLTWNVLNTPFRLLEGEKTGKKASKEIKQIHLKRQINKYV